MHTACRVLYAAGLAAWLVPAAASRIKRSGLASIRIKELLALGPNAGSGSAQPLWVHAVSVGELRAADILLAHIKKHKPDLPILLTCTTEAARHYATGILDYATVSLPIDFASVMRRFIRIHNPRACLLLEQELWPNLIQACSDAGIPVAVANGRMSERSARNYARAKSFTASSFASLSAVAASDRAAARRYRVLGAPRTCATGNLKHDAKPDEQQVTIGHKIGERMRNASDSKPVVLLASTRPGEEQLLLPCLRKNMADNPLIVVPRHPERASEVEAMLRRFGWDPVRKSSMSGEHAPTCLLADTLGEMTELAAASDVAFVGGSLLEFGGQNPLEQLAVGVPVVMGPSIGNVRELAAAARRAGALRIAADANSVVRELADLAGASKQAGQAGLRIAQAQRGAAARTFEFLAEALRLN